METILGNGCHEPAAENEYDVDDIIEYKSTSDHNSGVESYYYCVDDRYPICDMTLPEIYERTAKLNNGKGVTYYRPAERMTYTEIYHKAMGIAKGLIALGVKKGDNVICLGTQGADGMVMFIATSSMGAVFATPYLYTPIVSIISMFLRRLNPKVVLVGNAPIGVDQVNPYQYVVDALEVIRNEGLSVPHVYYDTLAENDLNEPLKDKVSNDWNPLQKLIELGESTVSDETLREFKSKLGQDDPCLYSASSGSTGVPKLVLMKSAFFTNGGMRKEERYGATADSVYSCPNMASEEIGLIEEIACSFYTSREVVVMPHPTCWDCEIVCKEMLELIERHKVNFVYADQYYTSYILNHVEMTFNYDLSHLKTWVLGGSGTSRPFKEQMLMYWPGSVDAYGMTENYYSVSPYIGGNVKKVMSIGKVMVNQEVKIVDENGKTVPRNTKGEMWIRGYGNFLEYKDQPELTQQMLSEDGWLKTGDCCVMDEDGDIQVIGRMADSERFKVNGDVIYAQYIEKIMREHPMIREIVVIGRHTGCSFGHELCYCIIPKTPNTLTPVDIHTYAKQVLVFSNQWPYRVYFFDKFPLQGARNKISRKQLLEYVKERVASDFYDALVEKSYEL